MPAKGNLRLGKSLPCEISSVVERYPSKLDVSGSNPLFRFPLYKGSSDNAVGNGLAVVVPRDSEGLFNNLR